MTIAPVVKYIDVKAPPARAFALFAERMGSWWPRGKTIGEKPHADIIVEPHPGGRWYERDEAGTETPWGQVLVWEPPARLVLGWQLDSSFRFDADMLTEVELAFVALPEGGTRVTLEHRNLERYGEDAPRIAGLVGPGWGDILQLFASAADA